MIRNYLKIAWRTLHKNKLYTGINIFGLAIGIASCLLIGLYIANELDYDKFNKNANRIVRATMEYKTAGTVNKTATTGTKVGPQFKRTFPSVEEYVRTYLENKTFKSGGDLFDEPSVLYADRPFFRVFSFKILAGNAATALDAPDKIVLTRSMAKKYFGNTDYKDILNKTIASGDKNFRVSAICEDAPQNSQIKFDFVTQFLNLGNNVKEEQWWTANWITYFLVKDESDIPQLQKQVVSYMDTPEIRRETGMEGESYLTYHLEPLAKVHLYSSLPGFEPNGSIINIYMLAVIAVLILIIACANYTNLATAQTVGRGGEIGMRKVMGASKSQVFVQFIGESSIITFIAAGIALLLAVLLVPYFNNMTGRHFTSGMVVRPLSIIALIVLSLLVSLFAGLYPAWVLSGTQILGVLKKGFSLTGGNNTLRKTLIVAQFGISIFLIIYTVIILQQMNFMKTKNLGYTKDHVMILPIGPNMRRDFENLKAAFVQVPGVQDVTASYETPEFVKWGDGITAIDEKGQHDISLKAMPVDLDFTKTMKMQLVAGRDFRQSDFAMMDTSNNNANYHLPYIINETLAKKIGWTPQQAIGRQIENRATGPVVGVVKDFNFSSLHDPIGPLLIFLSRDLSRDFLVRIKGEDIESTLSGLENVWKQRVNDKPFNYHFLDEDYNKLYLAEKRTSSLFRVAAALAIILAALGLFGLAAFTTVQRTKEIGIRKTLGASLGNILLLISRNFLILVSVSVAIASPLAFWAAKKWLQNFTYRVEPHVYVIGIAAMATLLITFITVGYHAIKAALANPVKSLRTE